MSRLPSERQVHYLKGLGYEGLPPGTTEEASAAIEAMVEGRNSAEAETAMLKRREFEKRQSRRSKKQELAAIKQQIKWAVQQNKEYGGEGLFAGFKFVETEQRPNPAEAPYLGTFLPLRVAQKFPQLLVVESIDYEEVLSDEKLPRKTRMVIKPGKFRPIKKSSGGMGCILVILLILVALVYWLNAVT